MLWTPDPFDYVKHKSDELFKIVKKIIVLKRFIKICIKYTILAVKDIQKLTAKFTGA